MEEFVNINLSNTYGGVFITKNDNGKCYLQLDDYSSVDSVEISEKLFEAIKSELG